MNCISENGLVFRTPIHPLSSKIPTYWVYYKNGSKLGDFEKDVDGYYKLFPNKDKWGYLPAEVLSAMAELLNELNSEWNSIVEKECGV